MRELERDLRALGAAIEFPPTPSLAPRVRARIEHAPRRTWLARRQALAVALATLAVAAVAVLAVPQARTAVLRSLGIGAVTIQRVDTLPAARERALTAGLGPPLTRAEAERRAGFELALPPLEPGAQPRFYAERGFAAVALEHEREPVLLVELQGSQLAFGKKVAVEGTRVEPVSVGGASGLWIEGAPHVVMWERPDGQIRERTLRIAGNTLLWTRGDLTLRLEGELTRAQSLALAREVE